jgi:hypothetical protein
MLVAAVGAGAGAWARGDGRRTVSDIFKTSSRKPNAVGQWRDGRCLSKIRRRLGAGYSARIGRRTTTASTMSSLSPIRVIVGHASPTLPRHGSKSSKESPVAKRAGRLARRDGGD